MTPALAALSAATASGLVGGAERRAERHVDDVHVVVDRPLDGVDDHVGGALAAEDPDRVQVGLRGDARADVPVV